MGKWFGLTFRGASELLRMFAFYFRRRCCLVEVGDADYTNNLPVLSVSREQDTTARTAST
jgi:hypothetical protein